MSKKLRELQARKAAAAQAKAESLKAASIILDKAAADSRDLTPEEDAAFAAARAAAAAKDGDIERIQAQIDTEQDLIAATAMAGTVVTLPGNGGDIRVSENRDLDPRLGFASFGEFAQSVRQAGLDRGFRDDRLAAAPGTFGSEAVGADGGFLVPPEFSRDIFNLSLTDDALLPLTDNIDVQGNSMVFPTDETTPWGTDGVRAYWQAEAAAAAATKPKFGTATLRLHKLMALVPLTDELLADSNALTGYLPNLFGRSIRWKTNEAILFGAGNGTPLGAMTGAAALTVAKESGQATATVQAANLFKMIAALPPGSFPNAVWMMGPDVLPAVFGLTLGNYPIYLPVSAGAQGSPYGTLLGRPIMVSQHTAAFSSAGDIALLDLSYYRTITKAGGIETASSMHLYFDADATAFRATFRVDGQPKIKAQINQAKGTGKLSPFVQLGAR